MKIKKNNKMNKEINESKICNFCLESGEYNPNLREKKTGNNLIDPCFRCNLLTHRDCLIKWFNLHSSDKFQIIDSIHLEQNQNVNEENNRPDNELNRITNIPQDESNGQNINNEQLQLETRIYIRISTELLSRFFSNIRFSVTNEELRRDNDNNINIENNRSNFNETTNHREHQSRNDNHRRNKKNKSFFYVLVSCPQCKNKIVIIVERSQILSFESSVRTFITKVLQFAGIFLGVTSGIAGILTIMYIGLTSCGLKMMEFFFTTPLLLRLLKKNDLSFLFFNYEKIYNLISRQYKIVEIKSIEEALFNGLIDPLKLPSITILPIMLFKLRSSSIFFCFFGENKSICLNNIIHEIFFSAYISSLSNHHLYKILLENFRVLIQKISLNPLSTLSHLNIFKNIEFWNTNNLISFLIPIRWAYEVFYKLAFNTRYFDLAYKNKITIKCDNNNTKYFDKLDKFNTKIENLELIKKNLKSEINHKVDNEYLKKKNFFGTKKILKFFKKFFLLNSVLIKKKIPFQYFKLKILFNFNILKASFQNNYSNILIKKSFSTRLITTFLWPFSASKIGSIFFNITQKYGFFKSIESEKLTFLTNLFGLVFVVSIKDIVNLYLSYKKASQTSKIKVDFSKHINKKFMFDK